jgi:hypothetical protein
MHAAGTLGIGGGKRHAPAPFGRRVEQGDDAEPGGIARHALVEVEALPGHQRDLLHFDEVGTQRLALGLGRQEGGKRRLLECAALAQLVDPQQQRQRPAARIDVQARRGMQVHRDIARAQLRFRHRHRRRLAQAERFQRAAAGRIAAGTSRRIPRPYTSAESMDASCRHLAFRKCRQGDLTASQRWPHDPAQRRLRCCATWR